MLLAEGAILPSPAPGRAVRMLSLLLAARVMQPQGELDRPAAAPAETRAAFFIFLFARLVYSHICEENGYFSAGTTCLLMFGSINLLKSILKQHL